MGGMIDLLRTKMERMAEQRVELGSSGLNLENYSTDWTTPMGKKLIDYAKSRGVPEWFIETGRVGYFRKGAMYGRLAFLVVENGLQLDEVIGEGLERPQGFCSEA